MSMLLMLGVLWMMITRASDPGVWCWLANDPDGGKKTASPDDDEPVTPASAGEEASRPAAGRKQPASRPAGPFRRRFGQRPTHGRGF